MTRLQQLAVSSFVAILLLFAAHSASAFCQATTCDPTAGYCKTNSQGCLAQGKPLSWAGGCVTVSVQATGSPKWHIDYAAALGSVTRAFAAWTSAPCMGGGPSIVVDVRGPISCSASEYNSDRGNANIVVFREGSWPYVGGEDALGLTRIRFDPSSGEIWDSDIEVNAVAEPLSVGDPTPQTVDLDSLLTHEAGHLLGLAHNTMDATATMFPGYHKGSITLRTLAPDDIAGVCNAYPPDRSISSSSCEPRHGYSDLCGAEQPAAPPDSSGQAPVSSGCSLSTRSPRSLLAVLFTLAGALVFSKRRGSRTR